jgi:hypothetical protein
MEKFTIFIARMVRIFKTSISDLSPLFQFMFEKITELSDDAQVPLVWIKKKHIDRILNYYFKQLTKEDVNVICFIHLAWITVIFICRIALYSVV